MDGKRPSPEPRRTILGLLSAGAGPRPATSAAVGKPAARAAPAPCVVPCPNCARLVHAGTVNIHLDACLQAGTPASGASSASASASAATSTYTSASAAGRRRPPRDEPTENTPPGAASNPVADAWGGEGQERRAPQALKRARAETAPGPRVGGARLVACPACGKADVPLETLNFHLDSEACSALAEGGAARERAADEACLEAGTAPPGLRVLRDFLSPEEEAELVRRLDAQPWAPKRFNGSSHTQEFGLRNDWAQRATRRPDPGAGEANIPEWMDFIVERFRTAHPALAAWWPNNCNANEYVPSRGDFLRPHFDNRTLAGEIIVNVSLLSDCYMTFSRPNAPAAFRVLLPRRGASIMSRAARWDFQHEIKHEDFLGERRISINFRQMVEKFVTPAPATSDDVRGPAESGYP